MKHRTEIKNSIYEQLARVGKALSSPKRLELVDLLRHGPRTVDNLAREAGLSLANTSRHLQILRESRLIDANKQAQHVTYHIADQSVCEFFRSLCTLAEKRLAEFQNIVREVINNDPYLERLDRQGLKQRVQEDEITVLDVRPAEEYRAGHIPGAISVPLQELDTRLSELPKERKIVAYCRGPYCLLASEAVEVLRSQGFDAVRIPEGVHEWQAAGLTIETSY